MPKELLSIVIPPGQTEQVDPRVLGPQKLRVAQNVRQRKDGRASKKYGNAAVATTVATGSSGTVGTGLPNAITQLGESEVFVSDCTVWKNTVAGWYNAGRVSRFLPARSNSVFRYEVGREGLWFGGVARTGNYVLFVAAYLDSQAATPRQAFWFVRDKDTDALIRQGRINGEAPKCIAVGATFHILYVDAGGNDLRVTSIDTSTLGVSDASIATVVSGYANHQAAPCDSTEWYAIYQTASNNIRVARMSGTTISASADTTPTTSSQKILAVMGTGLENAYIAWSDSGTAFKVKVYNDTLTSVTGGPTTVATGVGEDLAQGYVFGLVRYSSTQALFVYGDAVADGGVGSQLVAKTVTSAGVAATLCDGFNLLPASIPFTVNDRFYVFAHNIYDDTAVAQQRRYVLLDITENQPRVEATCDPIQATTRMGSGSGQGLSYVVDDGTHLIWACSSMLRETSDGQLRTMMGIDAVRFYPPRSTAGNLYGAYRQSVQVGKTLYFAGGYLAQLADRAVENGFSADPRLPSVTSLGSGGALTAGTYQYVAVTEWLDPATGERHRSAPSEPKSVTAVASDSVLVKVLGLSTSYRNVLPDGTTAVGPTLATHLYRTAVGGSIFYRITPNGGTNGLTPNISDREMLEFTDDGTVNDTELAANEILYTQGGVLANDMPPSCRCIAVAGNRVWLGGLLVENKVVCSKIIVPGEPVQFTDDDAFAVYFPEPIEAIAGLDGTLVALAKRGIYVIAGDGPNDQGQGTFTDPRELPAEEGCIDFRSVVVSSLGIFYQGKRGLWLIPRGFGAPQLMSDVQETLMTYPVITGAAQCVEQGDTTHLGESTVRFLASDAASATASRCVVFDTRTGSWSVDNLGVTLGVCGMWSDKFAFSRAISTATSPIRQETFTAFGNLTSWAETKLGTGDIRPFGIMGWGDFPAVQILAEYRAACKLKVDCWVDDESQPTWTYTMPAASETAGELVPFEYVPKVRTGSSIRVDVYDLDDGSSGATEGLAIHAIQIVAVPSTGPRRMPATTHRGP